MSVLKKILDKKLEGKIDTKEKVSVHSELLGETITFTKQPISRFLDILAKHDAIKDDESVDMGAMIPMMNELIFEFSDMFKNGAENKKAMEVYGAPTPLDLPEYVFEGDMTEMTKMFEAINSLYAMDKVDDEIKN